MTGNADGAEITAVIADDHPMFRDGVARSNEEHASCKVLARCGSADDVLKAVQEHLPDIALIDISMPGGGIEAARRITASCPVVRVLMLTVSEDEKDVMSALEAGASGYVLKGVGGQELGDIVQSVCQGGVYVSPELASRMLVDARNRKKVGGQDPFSDLTVREEQILKQVAAGQSNREIADRLSLSEKTVKHYMTNVLQKLQVRNRVEAALRARDHFDDL
jgi:two-component system nitrate/nitrite response regulator NarL